MDSSPAVAKDVTSFSSWSQTWQWHWLQNDADITTVTERKEEKGKKNHKGGRELIARNSAKIYIIEIQI